MPLLSRLSVHAGQYKQLARYANLLRSMGARNVVYYRTSKAKKTLMRDYDDGYYYRNGEERYAQTMRNKQEEALRFDDLYYKLSKHKRHFNQKWVDFPNCTCAEDLAEFEKTQPKGPRPQTACAPHEHSRIYDL